jgi:hypothetical protein
MNFTILTPGDCPVMYDKSDATHSNFGGNRANTENVSLQPQFDKHLSTSYVTVSGGATISGVTISGVGVYDVYGFEEKEIPAYNTHIELTYYKYNYELYHELVASGIENKYIIPAEYDFYLPGTGDYTHRYGNAPSIEENPVDTAVRDIDDMSNLEERKNDFSQQEIRADVQKGNEGIGIQSDPENRPRMDEGTDAVQVPSSEYRKQLKKTNRWQFDKSEHYEGEIS